MAGRLFMGAALPVVALGGVAYWMKEKRGGLNDRLEEKVGAAYKKRVEMKDKYTERHHQELLSSYFSTHLDDRYKSIKTGNFYSRQDGIMRRKSYNRGYLAQIFPGNKRTDHHIFMYDENLKVNLPNSDEKTCKGFVFAGSPSDIGHPNAVASIFDENYIRCESEFDMKNQHDKSSGSKNRKIDVIITGTTDPRTCSEFKRAYLRDVAYLAATTKGPVDPQSPCSDTPVFYNNSKTEIKETGDLTNLPEEVKAHISLGDYTACDFFTQIKTRQSHGKYKPVGAIIAGLEDEKVCESLYFGYLEKYLAALKEQPKKD